MTTLNSERFCDQALWPNGKQRARFRHASAARSGRAVIVDQTPTGMQLYCIVDNLSAHSTWLVEEFLDCPENHHVFLHRTATPRQLVQPG